MNSAADTTGPSSTVARFCTNKESIVWWPSLAAIRSATSFWIRRATFSGGAGEVRTCLMIGLVM